VDITKIRYSPSYCTQTGVFSSQAGQQTLDYF
jgi:hypothetical protein